MRELNSKAEQHGRNEYRPYCLADRPNHVRILQRAACQSKGFGVLTQATVSETVENLVAELDVPVIVDCGAFAAESFEGTLVELFDTYERMNADYGLLPDEIGERIATNESVAAAIQLGHRGPRRWSFVPVAVAQGETPAEYASSYWDCYQMGADRIAVGGLLQTDGDRSGGHTTSVDGLFDILDQIRRRNPRIWRNTWTFALGCDHPRRRPRFASLGVHAADSKRWLYQYDEDLPASRTDQLVNEVVETATHRTMTLTESFLTDGDQPAFTSDSSIQNADAIRTDAGWGDTDE